MHRTDYCGICDTPLHKEMKTQYGLEGMPSLTLSCLHCGYRLVFPECYDDRTRDHKLKIARKVLITKEHEEAIRDQTIRDAPIDKHLEEVFKWFKKRL